MTPKPLVKFTPERLPERKRMTICIGILASDGIVIAADAQESDQYYKRSQQKILPFVGPMGLGNNPTRPSMACAFTGAGDAGFLDAFFSDCLEDLSTSATLQEFKQHIASKIRTFHKQHLFPLAVASHPPEIQVLIGAYVQWNTCMFVSRGSALRRAFPYAAVGVGAHFASSLIEDLFGLRSVKETELVAAYVVAATKERIEGCGKWTQIISLHNPQIKETPGEPAVMHPPDHVLTHVPQDKIRKWEDSFGRLWAVRQRDLINELIVEQLKEEAS